MLLLSLIAVIILDSLLSPKLDLIGENNGNLIFVSDSVGDDERAILLGGELEGIIKDLENESSNRHYNNRLEIMEEGFGGSDYDINYAKYAMGGKGVSPNTDERRTYHHLIDSKQPLPPYNLKEVVDSTLIYNGALGILVYDPDDDKFVLLYSTRHQWHEENDKLLEAFKTVSYLLRKLFPDRFQGVNSSEFAMPISAGGYPHVTTKDCVKEAFDKGLEKQSCVESHFTKAPILHFGNVFSNEYMYPNIIPMPMPGNHLYCFRQWADSRTICEELRHLVYGDEGIQLQWSQLIPQVIWRGEDFGYMATVPPGEKLKYNGGLRRTIHDGTIPIWEKNNDVSLSFQEEYSTLLARWRGVLLTVQAVQEWKRKYPNWKERNSGLPVPWCNIRFNRYEEETGHSKKWENLQKIGTPVVGDRIEQNELSKYRYLIDLGSNSWEDKLGRLARPGLLFHHVTPTRGSSDDYMEPWVHYIPVSPQLDDLKAKFDWAESHPEEAKAISDRGTELAKYLTSNEGFDRVFGESLVEPLQRAIEAYQPLTKRGHKNWRREIDEVYADKILPVMNCNGKLVNDCKRLVGEKAFANTEVRRENCQIIYIIGVEGSSHHGFLPIIKRLAEKQIDPDTGLQYDIDDTPRPLKAGLFGWYQTSFVKQKWGFKGDPGVDNPAFAESIISSMCPNDGRRHVVIEWASFPSGQETDIRSYRVKRQNDWLQMTPQEIANDPKALVHPVDLEAFYDTYATHAEIKLVVLHRPFLETITSHKDWDGGPIQHSNIISGFMIILSRFLNSHIDDLVTGTKLWTLLCMESIYAKNYQSAEEVNEARKRVLLDLVTFLGWPVTECVDCFNSWHESSKIPEKALGLENMKILFEHMAALEGIWPPKRSDDISQEQQCKLPGRRQVNHLPEAPTATTVTIYSFGTRGLKAQSIFHTGLLDRFGTGRVDYVLEQMPHCAYSEFPTPQNNAPCLAVNYADMKNCPFEELVLHYPNCKTMLTNDENCAQIHQYDARGYYSSNMMDKMYLPLGPRYDSWEAFNTLMSKADSSIPLASQRKYNFNAIFAKSTAHSRSTLEQIIEMDTGSLSSFVKISEDWAFDPNRGDNDSVDSAAYMQVLLESTFTLAPSGHNPECFRLYEAVESGSIPVVAIDEYYRNHQCKDSLIHWLSSPIIVLESWSELMSTLQQLLEEPEALDKRQAELRAWYDDYMRSSVTNFESFLLSES